MTCQSNDHARQALTVPHSFISSGKISKIHPSWSACWGPHMAQAYIDCRDHISVQDLEWFLPPTKAANALSVLDIDGDGKISLSDMRDAVVSIYKERKNLAFTLKVASLCI